MFFKSIRVYFILLIMVMGNIYAEESNVTHSKPLTSQVNSYDIGAAIFSPDGKYLISGSTELVTWDLYSAKVLKSIPADSSGGITSLSFSPDGKYLLSGGYDKIIKLWDVKTWKVIKKFHSDANSHYLTFSPDMKYILSGNGYTHINWDDESKQYTQKSDTWKYELWEIESEKKVKDFNQSVDRETLALFGIESKDIKPLPVNIPIGLQQKMYKQIDKIQNVRNAFERLRFAQFSLDKKYVIALHFIAIQGSYLGALVLWDSETMKIVKEFK